jgi:hypothetical protein
MQHKGHRIHQEGNYIGTQLIVLPKESPMLLQWCKMIVGLLATIAVIMEALANLLHWG